MALDLENRFVLRRSASDFISFHQPVEHLVFGDALLDLAQPSRLLQRRIDLSRIGAALARPPRPRGRRCRLRVALSPSRSAIVSMIRSRRTCRSATGRNSVRELLALFFGNLVRLHVAVDQLADPARRNVERVRRGDLVEQLLAHAARRPRAWRAPRDPCARSLCSASSDSKSPTSRANASSSAGSDLRFTSSR